MLSAGIEFVGTILHNIIKSLCKCFGLRFRILRYVLYFFNSDFTNGQSLKLNDERTLENKKDLLFRIVADRNPYCELHIHIRILTWTQRPQKIAIFNPDPPH